MALIHRTRNPKLSDCLLRDDVSTTDVMCAAQRIRTLPGRRLRARAGFSLAEVVVALAILTAALLGLALFVSRMAHATSDSRLLGTATELVTNRIETIKGSTDYASIDTFATTETSIPGSSSYAGFTRQTLILHVGGGVSDSVDYRVVTVIVTNPVMSAPVRKTTAIASF